MGNRDAVVPDAAAEELPLTPVQEAMWVSWQLEPERWAHIIPLTLTVRGTLDLDRLRDAVNAVCARYPLLRGRVLRSAEEMRMTWADAPAVPFVAHRVAADTDQVIAQARRKPFDLERGPLMRVDVIQGPDSTTVVLSVHHLVLDGTSIVILLGDLSRAYCGGSLGRPQDPGPLVAHARRSRELATGGEGEPLRKFWRETLADIPPGRPLPAHLGQGPYRPWISPIPSELEEGARRVARDLGVTYFTVIFGALFVTLHHHTGTEDLVIGTPHHGRTDTALYGCLGSFVNVMPIRQRLRSNDTYQRLLGKLRADVRAGIAHADLPLPTILHTANLAGPDARARTHQVVLTYWNAARDPATDIRHLEFAHGSTRAELDLVDAGNTSDYRLTVLLQEDSDGCRLVWQDPGQTIDPELISTLARDHLSVVADMVAAPGRTLAAGSALLPPPKAMQADLTSEVDTTLGAASPIGRPATVQALAEIWRELLRVPEVSADDSFFALGGQSLTATTLLARINERLGVEASIRDLFTYPVLRELAGVVDQRRPTTKDATDVRESLAGETLPASRFQEGIWLAERLDPHAHYHVPLSWDVTGLLDPDVLRSALHLLTARQEILRTRFVDRDGRLFQEVMPPWSPKVVDAELTGLVGRERTSWLTKWSDAAAETLTMSEGRLLSVGLFTVAESRQVLAVCAHHLVLDGESVPLLLRELELCYAVATGQPEPALPRHQYRDLVAAEDPSAADLAYWRRHLTGVPSALGLRPPEKPVPHGGIVLPLAADTAAALFPVRLDHKVSLFMIAATAVAAVLHRWTKLDDLTFGIPVAQRSSTGSTEILGPSLNTLVLRSQCDDDTKLGDLLQHLREEIIGAFEHQDVPFEEIVRELRPARTPGGTPYVDVMVNNVGLSRWSAQLGDARLTPVDFVSQGSEVSKFAMTITFAEASSALTGTLSYRGDRISAEDAHRLAQGIADVLNQFESNRSIPVSDLALPCQSAPGDTGVKRGER